MDSVFLKCKQVYKVIWQNAALLIAYTYNSPSCQRPLWRVQSSDVHSADEQRPPRTTATPQQFPSHRGIWTTIDKRVYPKDMSINSVVLHGKSRKYS